MATDLKKSSLQQWSEKMVHKSLKQTESKFIKIRCSKCKNEQVIFGKTSTSIVCLLCSKSLAEPTGGKAKIKARILEVLE